jgi:putative hemolysin
MRQFYYVLIGLVLSGGLLMSACTPASSPQPEPSASAAQPSRPAGPSQTPAPANTSSNLANPASVNCVQKGNRLEIRTAADGSQVGICIFPDGSQCEEWAFFRGECAQGTLTPATANPTATVPGMTETPQAPAGPALTATPAQNGSIDPAVQKQVVGAAQALLAKKLNVKASQISLVSIAPVSWPDSCLGLPGPQEMCAQMITDGFKVVLSVNGQNYTLHTDQTGQNIRQEP